MLKPKNKKQSLTSQQYLQHCDKKIIGESKTISGVIYEIPVEKYLDRIKGNIVATKVNNLKR